MTTSLRIYKQGFPSDTAFILIGQRKTDCSFTDKELFEDLHNSCRNLEHSAYEKGPNTELSLLYGQLCAFRVIW